MTVSADITQRARRGSRLRLLVSRHPVAAFLAMVFAVNIVVACVPVLTRPDVLPVVYMPLYSILGPIFGVALPAFLVVAATGGRAGVGELASRCLRWRVGVRWYLVAVLSVPIATLLCATVVFGGDLLDVLASRWTQLFTSVLPQLVVLVVFAIVAEEIGFMGFLQARWQDSFGPLKASVLVTVPFALYHLPGLMVDSHLGLSKILLALGYLAVLAVLQMFGRIVMMWMYNVTAGSVLLVGLWHSSFDATTTAFGHTFAIAGPVWKVEVAGFWIPSAVIAVFAVLVVFFTRGRLGYRATAESEPVAETPLGPRSAEAARGRQPR
jgi:membrane protease YdiL (CAAX protease family)